MESKFMEMKITERGWGGHFIGCRRCLFRRNTLLEYGDKQVVVSTVGDCLTDSQCGIDTIGYERYFETKAFFALDVGKYIDADVHREIEISAEHGMYAASIPELVEKYGADYDNYADTMHDNVVREIRDSMIAGTVKEITCSYEFGAGGCD